MILVYAKKKKALILKKVQKALQPIKKVSHRKKSTKKHYGAFKSTHYNPCRDDPNSNSTSSLHSTYLLCSSASSVQSITGTNGLLFAMILGVFLDWQSLL